MDHFGPRNTFNFVLSVRDGQGELVAGLIGETLWNALLVSVLWVHAAHRKSGYGTALMGRAEQIARERACEVVFLNTMTFQAPVSTSGFAGFPAEALAVTEQPAFARCARAGNLRMSVE
jgi:GNAT superfamily N-acetyltransferase